MKIYLLKVNWIELDKYLTSISKNLSMGLSLLVQTELDWICLSNTVYLCTRPEGVLYQRNKLEYQLIQHSKCTKSEECTSVLDKICLAHTACQVYQIRGTYQCTRLDMSSSYSMPSVPNSSTFLQSYREDPGFFFCIVQIL